MLDPLRMRHCNNKSGFLCTLDLFKYLKSVIIPFQFSEFGACALLHNKWTAKSMSGCTFAISCSAILIVFNNRNLVASTRGRVVFVMFC